MKHHLRCRQNAGSRIPTAVPCPNEWGERVTGVKTRLATKEKVIALTFDACGSAKGMGIDMQLVEFLEKERVPATLFMNARWIEGNRTLFDQLAGNVLVRDRQSRLSAQAGFGDGKIGVRNQGDGVGRGSDR